MTEIVKPFSPVWWRDRLLAALEKQQREVAKLERYNDGDHPLPSPPQAMNEAAFDEAKKAFLTLSKLGKTNVLPLIAKAPADRLSIRGFRFGETIQTDDAAWQMWQRNHLDADHRLLIDTALVCRNSYGMVWGDSDGNAVMTCEHPSEMIVAYEPGSRRKRSAALKCYADESGRFFCNLYLPEAIYKWQTRSSNPVHSRVLGFGTGWVERAVPGETWPLPNPLGVVPVVEFAVNAGLRARPFGGGVGEFEPFIINQDRLNKGTFDMLVTAEHQAYRQRWTIGYTPPLDPTTGQPDPRAQFRAGQATLMHFPEGTAAGEFGQADFSGFLKMREAEVTFIATASLTPQSYLPLDLKNLGAETLVQTNIGFVAKTQRHSAGLGESFEEYVRLGLLVQDDPRAQDQQTQVLWDPIEVRTLGEVVDAALKLKTLEVPDEVLWAMVPGVSQQDINLWKSLGISTSFLTGANVAQP